MLEPAKDSEYLYYIGWYLKNFRLLTREYMLLMFADELRMEYQCWAP